MKPILRPAPYIPIKREDFRLKYQKAEPHQMWLNKNTECIFPIGDNLHSVYMPVWREFFPVFSKFSQEGDYDWLISSYDRILLR